MNTTFKGVIGAPVTPFTSDNILDLKTLEKLVNFLIGSGVNAIGVPMHIGESLNLSLDERKNWSRLPSLLSLSRYLSL